MRYLTLSLIAAVAVSCASSPGGVVEKVKYDFGIGEKPEGYEAPSDKVMANLDNVGKTELKRMNVEGRHGEVKFEEKGELEGKYYKESKVYEDYHPLEARAASHTSSGDRGYIGFIEYSYRVYQSPRKSTRAEAAAESASVPTSERGREVYRYTFSAGGVWDGKDGERSRR